LKRSKTLTADSHNVLPRRSGGGGGRGGGGGGRGGAGGRARARSGIANPKDKKGKLDPNRVPQREDPVRNFQEEVAWQSEGGGGHADSRGKASGGKGGPFRPSPRSSGIKLKAPHRGGNDHNASFDRPRPKRLDHDEDVPFALARYKPKAPVPGAKVIDGRLDLHPDGFGFLIAKDPTLPNVYVGEESLKHVMHRDEVRVRVDREFEGGKVRGTVLEILRRTQREFLGIARPYKGGVLVIPVEARDRKHAFKVETVAPQFEELKSGTAVLCRILTYPSNAPGTVEILEVVQDPAAASNDTLRVLLEAAWPREFSRVALNEAEHRALRWRSEVDPRRRRDITHLPLVTIDGRDARDFDDAVCAMRESSGAIRLWVAIADVSNFVRPGTALDREAFERSTSVYFPDHVVPMLPEVLSNGVCSLNPFEDRACLVCECVIDARGKVTGFEFYEGLMISKRRLTYEQMQAYIEEEPWALNELATLNDSLSQLVEVYGRLRKAKNQRGAIDLDLPEAQVMLDRQGQVLDIQTRTRLDAHRLIEECMLIANECAARFLEQAAPAGVYRIHEQPDEKKIMELVKFLSASSILPKKKNLAEMFEYPSDFADLLNKLKKDFEPGDPTARAAQSLVLRSLKQAKYSTARVGHFALATKDYTHFTSPIRRYPDLMVHRLIKEALGFERWTSTGIHLESLAQHCSDQERLAMDAERKLIEIKKCRYMEQFLGEEFEAWATGITEKGVFCQIEGHFVDGLISRDTLGSRGKLTFDPDQLAYIGPGKVKMHLGSRVRVLLAAVDVTTRRIDFDLVKLYSVGEKHPPREK